MPSWFRGPQAVVRLASLKDADLVLLQSPCRFLRFVFLLHVLDQPTNERSHVSGIWHRSGVVKSNTTPATPHHHNGGSRFCRRRRRRRCSQWNHPLPRSGRLTITFLVLGTLLVCDFSEIPTGTARFVYDCDCHLRFQLHVRPNPVSCHVLSSDAHFSFRKW